MLDDEVPETEKPNISDEVIEDSVVEDKKEEVKDVDDGKPYTSEDKGTQEQVKSIEPKLVKPGTAVAKEQSFTGTVSKPEKEFRPKHGPAFLRRLRRAPIEDV